MRSSIKNIIFVTGNQNKADYLSKLLGIKLEHQKIDLDELQTLDMKKLVEHKAKQAYEIAKRPVLVEDVSLEFNALGGLPGPYIKYFLQSTGNEGLCRMLDGFSDRSAVARCVFGFYDGTILKLFTGSLDGVIVMNPQGSGGWGWDAIFAPKGYGGDTRAQLNNEDDMTTYSVLKSINQLKTFLTSF